MKRRYVFVFLIATTALFLWFKINNESSVTPVTEQSAAISKVLKTKFILVWTNPESDPILHLGHGMESFAARKCSNTNCYVSSNRMFFDDIRKFDVLVFHAKELYDTLTTDMPRVRAPHQKYVFGSMESSDYYPICDSKMNDFFNLTWTYKLNSDTVFGYIVIRNKSGEIVGPKSVMHWETVDTMEPINDTIKEKLKTKAIAAAWFVSNCRARNERLEFATQLKSELKRYNLTLDIYGACGTKSCPSQHMKDCLQIVERDYYFYLSFENSFSEDYVTEKLLTALQHYAVPVVYGGANYSRFMPDGIYLDARKLGVQELALRMAEIIKDQEKYYDFFRWHNYYSYHPAGETPDSDCYCKLCALINNEELKSRINLGNFSSWWSPPGRCL